MYADEIKDYADAEMQRLIEEAERLIAYGQRLPSLKMTQEQIRPFLDGIEGVVSDLQALYDRCLERFPDAEADGGTHPYLAYLRQHISNWHFLWEEWHLLSNCCPEA
jgi:hypothetical protein